MEISPSQFGLKKSLWRQLLRQRNKTMESMGRDKFYRENDIPFYSKYNKLHPVQDCEVRFNSWGAREDFNFEMYKKKKIALCLGDSFTCNVGGRLEDSWPKQLGKLINMPIINLGMTRFGPDAFYTIAEKMRDYFDVQHIFAMYNLHGDEVVLNMEPALVDMSIVEEKIKNLKHEIPFGAHVVFDPPWAGWSKDQLEILYEYYPNAHAYLKDISFKYADIPFALFECLVENEYKDMCNKKWPTIEQIYYELVKHNELGDLLPKAEQFWFMRSIAPKCKAYFYRSRDYRHFSRLANQMVANYFYSQITGITLPN